MRVYIIVASELFLAFVVTWVCNREEASSSDPASVTIPQALLVNGTTATAPATRAQADPLAGLSAVIRRYDKRPDAAEQRRLDSLENRLKESLKSGWKPPWADLAVQLTDEGIQSLSTADLGRRLFDTGLPARTLMLYESPDYGIRRLEVLYKGYRELFLRPDCWKGLVAALDSYSAQLDVRANATVNVNAITGLTIIPEFYAYPPIRATLSGHEREIIAAHVRALKKLSEYLTASAALQNTERSRAFSTRMAPSALINWGLAISRSLSEQEYQVAHDRLSSAQSAARFQSGDIKSFVDWAIIELDRLAQLPDATQPTTGISTP